MDNKIVKDLIAYLMMASIFITGSGGVFFGFTFYWYYYFYILFALIMLVRYHQFDKNLLIVLVGIVIYSLVTYSEGLNLVVKQLINIAFAAIVFYNFLLFEQFDIEALFGKYIAFSKFILVVGFIQVALFLLGYGDYFIRAFPFLEEANTSFRFQSITQEPSFIAFVFAPIVFISVYNLLTRHFSLVSHVWSILFLASYLLTVSFIAYVGLAIMLALISMRTLNLVRILVAFFSVIIVFSLSFVAYFNIEAIRTRVDDTVMGASRNIINREAYLNVNLSSYALLTNAYVVKRTLADNFFVGTGLGTHPLNYDRYLPWEMREYKTLNKEDANSMALRLLSETGVIGFFVFVLFVFRYKLRFHDTYTEQQKIWWLINSGIFVMIILFLLRNGHYTIHGRILFLLLYYYTSRFAHRPMRFNNRLHDGQELKVTEG